MCGRFVAKTPIDALTSYFSIDETLVEEPLGERFNVAPTDPVYAIAERDGSRKLRVLRWGLVPSWADDPKVGARFINARAENVADTPAFRKAFVARRCLIPADGFYEWQKLEPNGSGDRGRGDGGRAGGKPRKVPHYICDPAGEPFAFAGLFELWRPRDDPDAKWLRTAAIITTTPNAAVASLHDRMPVILAMDNWDRWLDPSYSDKEQLKAMLLPAPAERTRAFEVNTAVNTVTNDGHELIEPV